MKDFIAGTYVNQGYYKSFQPEFINREWQIDNMELIQLLSQADRQIGRLDMYSEYLPDIDLFISMHVLKEATLASKIEGTKTNIEDALQEKADLKAEARNDWEEVQNYIKALNAAIQKLEELPLSSRLIKEAHQLLLQGVRGENKLPGAFRRSQNWIGGATINDARFIPPVHTTVESTVTLKQKTEPIFSPTKNISEKNHKKHHAFSRDAFVSVVAQRNNANTSITVS